MIKPKRTPKQQRIDTLKNTKGTPALKFKEKITGDFRSTSKTSNIVTDKEIDALPAQIKDDILEEDVNIVFRPNPGPQTEFLAATETEVLYGGARGGGKGGRYVSEIITPFGKRKMEDIHVGDIISNPDGSPQKVIKETELGVVPVYRFHFIDGSTTEVSDDHLWLIHKTCRASKLKNYSEGFFKGEIYTTKEIREWLDRKNSALDNQTIKQQNLIIPLCRPIQFTKSYKVNPIDIHPYVLGCLLGDGCMTKKEITIASADIELVDRIRELGYNVTSYENSITHRFTTANNLDDKLQKLKLLGKHSYNKFIPEYYKWASIENRFELIRGLMDTDGYADDRGHLEYCTISKQLAQDIKWVLKSLGAKVTIQEKIPTYTYKGEKKQGQLAYILYIQSDHNEKFFWLDRKVKRCEHKKYNGGHGDLGLRIEKVEYIGDHRCKCITVRNSNGLYLQDDFIVTHNSYSLLVDPLRYCHKAQHNAVIIRRTMPELRDLINHSRALYPKAFPGAKYSEVGKEWRFPSGARIEFGYLETQADVLQFQGRAYSWVGIDEIGQFAEYNIIRDLLGSLRSVDITIPTFFRCSANPGGIGSHWIKEHFIDPAPPNTPFFVPVDPDDPNSDTISRRFIPARLYDNPYLTQTKAYENMLKSLPENKRKMWLEGRWDIIEGAAFEEFDPRVHVVEQFDIPSNWPKWRAADWGFSSPFCVLWMAADYDNNIYVYREFYGKGLTADIFAQRVRALEQGETVNYGVMDSSTWSRRGDVGPAVPEIMRQHGCVWRPSDRSPGSRHSGKMEVHRRLRVIPGPNGPTAKLKIFKNCRNLIQHLPALPVDPNDSEDVDTKALDHSYDALRYGLMSRPMDALKMDMYKQMDRYTTWRPANKVGY